MPNVPDAGFGPVASWVPNTFCCATAWAGYSDDLKNYATTASAFILWALTGRRFGLEELTVRPCNAPSLPPVYQTYPVWLLNPWGTDDAQTYSPAYIYNGVWHNQGCAGLGCCGAMCEVVLDGPIYSVSSVEVDGATIDPTAYRVDNQRLLVRQDGDCWPRCQNFDKAAGDTGTWTVTYLRGRLVPAPLLAAQGTLACEIALACTGGKCRLPQRMQSLSRQGVTVEFVQPNTYLDRGLTNLPDVDQVVALYNPSRLTSPPAVLSMDNPPPRITTWTSP